MISKRGDTLIEVALAIGIFSMIAITVVSVVSASTSGAQSSLELTLTREELDDQAEALRFIHDSYVSGSQAKTNNSNDYKKLWEYITSFAGNRDDDTVKYSPTVCSSDVYDGTTGYVKNMHNGSIPFIINTRQLNSPSDVNKRNIVIAGGGSTTDARRIFYATDTYPRIVYQRNTSSGDTTGESLQQQVEDTREYINRVEGIYIIAIRGDQVSIIDGNGNSSSKPAFYDFYIRSCWMPVGSDRASTISTVVRLYDPSIITY